MPQMSKGDHVEGDKIGPLICVDAEPSAGENAAHTLRLTLVPPQASKAFSWAFAGCG